MNWVLLLLLNLIPFGGWSLVSLSLASVVVIDVGWRCLCSFRPSADMETALVFVVGLSAVLKVKWLGRLVQRGDYSGRVTNGEVRKTGVINAMFGTRSTWSVSVFIKALWQIGRKEKQASPPGLKCWWIFCCLEMEFILKRVFVGLVPTHASPLFPHAFIVSFWVQRDGLLQQLLNALTDKTFWLSHRDTPAHQPFRNFLEFTH